MALAAKRNQLFGHVHCLMKIRSPVKTQHGRKFFMGKRIITADFRSFSQKNFCRFGHCYAGHGRNFVGRLANDSRIERAIDKDYICQSRSFFIIGKPGPAGHKFFPYPVRNGGFRDNGLFGGANHAIIKGLAEKN